MSTAGCVVCAAMKPYVFKACVCGYAVCVCTFTQTSSCVFSWWKSSTVRMCVACVMCVRSSLKDFTNEVA